jgi:formylmethanofuran dehydrogenase subunit C
MVGWADRTLLNKGNIVDQGSTYYGFDVDINGAAVLDNQGGKLAFKTGNGWADFQNNSGVADSLTIKGNGAVAEGSMNLSNTTFTAVADSVLAGALTVSAGSFTAQDNVTFGALSLASPQSTAGNKLNVTDKLTLSSGTLTLSGKATVSGTFNMTGGALTGVDTLTLSGATNTWTGGTMTGGGITEIAAGATLSLGGGSTTMVGWADRTLLNKGSIVDQGSSYYGVDVDLNGAAVLDNQGGTLAFKTGNGWADFQNNSGAVDSLTVRGNGTVTDGTFYVTSSSLSLVDGTSLAGAMSVRDGNLNLQGAAVLGSLSLVAGTITANGQVSVAGDFNMSGGALVGSGKVTLGGAGSTWTGGAMTGGGITEIAAGATLSLGGGSAALAGWSDRTLLNRGAIVDKGLSAYGVDVDLNGAAVLDNQGGTLSFMTSTGWADYGNNSGAADSLTVRGNGTITAGTFYVTNSSLSMADGTSLAGATSVNDGTLKLLGTVELGSLSLSGGSVNSVGPVGINGSFNMSGGSLTGTGNVTLRGSASRWSGGVVKGSGQLTISAGVTFTVSGAVSLQDGETILNNGTIVQTAGSVTIQNGATLTNNGTLDLQADVSWANAPGSPIGWVFKNHGLFTKSGGAGDAVFANVLYSSSGTVTVVHGRIMINGNAVVE